MESNLPPENNPPPPLSAPPPTPPSPPPPLNRPPPIISPIVMQRPARRGTAWKVFAIVLLALLGLSLLFNLRHFVSGIVNAKGGGSRAAGPRLEEVYIKDTDAQSKIAVVNVDGIISGEIVDQNGGFSMVSIIKEQLKRAKSDKDVKAVLLKVDSPGGEVLAADEIARAIREFRDSSHKPVVVSMGSLAASGGYYVSAPCDWIVANELTITGSIGVIMHGFNYRGLLDKVGVRPEVFKSGKFKDMLSGTKEPDEITPEERQMVQTLIDETFGKFKDVVRDGRADAYKKNQQRGAQQLNRDWEDYADGRILSGKQAKELGFVDEVGDFDNAVKRAEDLAGMKMHANLIQYQPVFDLSNLFRLFGKSDARGLKVDLGVDTPKLKSGYLYFIVPTYLR
jgi:protease-4